MNTRHFFKLLVLVALGLTVSLRAQDVATNAAPPSTPYLTPEEELKTFVMQPGYRLELVVSDPIIKEPVVAVFDGNGRMYVSEMRTYMQNIDGTGEHRPLSRISLHWSSKGDGVFDKHSVFLDNLVLPRMILPRGDGVLVNETDSDDIYLYTDTKGDGVADKKVLVYSGGKRGENLEHQSSGLIWARDNWLYQTLNNYRLRIIGTKAIKEETSANGGQWGASQDDYGKVFFVNASGEAGPTDFQELFIYGGFKARNEPSQSFMQPWPLVGLADFQGGLSRVRPEDQTLNHLTSSAGVDIFRGDRLPAELRGDMFFGEPVGRLVRRAKVEVRDGMTHLLNPYEKEKAEFIRSTDANFRPVNLVTAPDGTLYIVDMYRGIIQEATWVDPKSYLRPVVQKHGLENNFGRGRIWRLRYQGMPLGPQPHMQTETPAQLVSHLTHPNGWWRDTAQKLLVVRGDKSAVRPLLKMAKSNSNPVSRLDALWTLEGLDAVEPAFDRQMLKDKDAHVRAAAIRVSESLYKKGDKTLVPNVVKLTNDSDPNVVMQVLMTANLLKWPDSASLIQLTLAASPSQGVKELASQIHPAASRFAAMGYAPQDAAVLDHGEGIYKMLCYACHGANGEGAPKQGARAGTTMAPPFIHAQIASDLGDSIISVLLKGLTGPVNGKAYTELMVPMVGNDDAYIAAIASYVRNSFGNSAPLVKVSDVARMRAATRQHNSSWTVEELAACMPQPLNHREQWKVSASDAPDSAPLAVDGDVNTIYDSGAAQRAGMWYQIELPQETTLCGLRLDAGSFPQNFPQAFKIELSNDGTNWGGLVAADRGTRGMTDVSFAPTKGTFVRISITPQGGPRPRPRPRPGPGQRPGPEGSERAGPLVGQRVDALYAGRSHSGHWQRCQQV